MTDTSTTRPARTIDQFVTPETLALVLRVRAAEIQYAASSGASRVAQDAANWSLIDSASGCYLPTPEMRATMAHAEIDWDLLNVVYDETPATPDMPSDILLRIVERRLRDTTQEAWCKRVVELGGPTISARWLWEYFQSLRPAYKRRLPVPNRLRRAAVLMDANRAEPIALAA